MVFKCEYCQDSLFVDKYGNPKGQHVGKLTKCPACLKQTGSETPKLEIDVDRLLKTNIRIRSAWTIALDGHGWDDEKAEMLVKAINQTIFSKQGTLASRVGAKEISGRTRVEFHGSVPYQMIKTIMDHLQINKNEYQLLVDKIAEENNESKY